MQAFQCLLNFVKTFIDGLVHIIFPHLCMHCQCELSTYEKFICAFCWEKLQRTFFENTVEATYLDKMFWGRIELHHTFALYYFEKEKPIQEILHQLKYHHKAPLGIFMGQQIGKAIKYNGKFQSIQALIPVPIHSSKRFTRGYNQSELLAKGISNSLDIPLIDGIIHKRRNNASQTGKNRFLRWENTHEQFFVRKANVKYKHIALVDDVVTTGATIEAIVKQLHEVYPDLQITLLSFAVTK